MEGAGEAGFGGPFKARTWTGRSGVTALVRCGDHAWVATEGAGILVIDPWSGRLVDHLEFNGLLPSNCVETMAIDQDGEPILGTSRGLLRRVGGSWQRTLFRTRTDGQGLFGDASPSSRIRSVVCQEGRLWVRTDSGSFLEGRRTGEWLGSNLGPCRAAAVVDGDLWVARLRDVVVCSSAGRRSRLELSPMDYVVGMLPTPDGCVWVAGDRGPDVDRFRSGHARQSIRGPWPEGHLGVEGLAWSEHRLWFSTRYGLYGLAEDGSWEHVRDEEGTRTLALFWNTPMRLRTGHWAALGERVARPAWSSLPLPNSHVSKLFRIGEGTPAALVGGQLAMHPTPFSLERGLATWREGRWSPGGEVPEGLAVACAGPEGSLYGATWDPKGKKSRVFHFVDGRANLLAARSLPSSEPRALLWDPVLGLWLGTEGGGACHLVDKEWRCYRKHEGLPSLQVHCLARDPAGRLWAGTREGLAVFDGSSWQRRRVVLDQEPEDAWIRALEPGQGVLAVQASTGHRLDPDQAWAAFFRAPGYVQRADHITSDSMRLLFSTRRPYDDGVAPTPDTGVYSYDGAACERLVSYPQLPDGEIQALLHAEGAVWIGTRAGLARWEAPDVASDPTPAPKQWWDRYFPPPTPPKARPRRTGRLPEPFASLQGEGLFAHLDLDHLEEARLELEGPDTPPGDLLHHLLVAHHGFIAEWKTGLEELADRCFGALRAQGLLDLHLAEVPTVGTDPTVMRILEGGETHEIVAEDPQLALHQFANARLRTRGLGWRFIQTSPDAMVDYLLLPNRIANWLLEQEGPKYQEIGAS